MGVAGNKENNFTDGSSHGSSCHFGQTRGRVKHGPQSRYGAGVELSERTVPGQAHADWKTTATTTGPQAAYMLYRQGVWLGEHTHTHPASSACV